MIWRDCYQPYGVSSAPSNCQVINLLVVFSTYNTQKIDYLLSKQITNKLFT